MAPKPSLSAASSDRRGYLEANIAATAGQLGGRPPGRLVVNSREVLASTARVVGATLGEMHFNTFVALTMVYVHEGAPEDGAGAATLGGLHRLVHGEVSRHGRSTKGGRAYLAIVNALEDLFEAKLTVQGYDTVTGRLTPGGFSKTRLLVDLFWDEDLERARQGALLEGRSELAARLGAKRADNTVRWRFHQTYVARIHAGDLVTLDWEKLRALRGVAKTLWLQLSAPRFMFRPLPGQPDHEWMEISLTTEAYHALGVHAAEERDRRRTLNQAGRRILDVDPTYVVFEAHGGPRRPSSLRIVRRCVPPGDVAATLPGQLSLAA